MNTSAPESSPSATRFAAARTLAATLRMVSLGARRVVRPPARSAASPSTANGCSAPLRHATIDDPRASARHVAPIARAYASTAASSEAASATSVLSGSSSSVRVGGGAHGVGDDRRADVISRGGFGVCARADGLLARARASSPRSRSITSSCSSDDGSALGGGGGGGGGGEAERLGASRALRGDGVGDGGGDFRGVSSADDVGGTSACARALGGVERDAEASPPRAFDESTLEGAHARRPSRAPAAMAAAASTSRWTRASTVRACAREGGALALEETERLVRVRGESVAVGGREDRRGGLDGDSPSAPTFAAPSCAARASSARISARLSTSARLSAARAATTVANAACGCSNGAHRGEARLADFDAPGKQRRLRDDPAPLVPRVSMEQYRRDASRLFLGLRLEKNSRGKRRGDWRMRA